MSKIKKYIVQSSTMGNLVIKRVSKKKAKELIVENHYSHKWNNASFGLGNYGIFREGREDESECLGVAVYGYMKNVKAKIYTHPDPKATMLELNRMWISDELGKNAETILISRSLKLLREDYPHCVAVQSFADGRLGCGTIYKASNFKYYGKHQTIFLRNKRTGEVTHRQNLTNSTSRSIYVRENVAFLLKDFEIFKVDTYRYIYPFCKRFKFKTAEKPYPPYNKGTYPCDWVRDKEKIKQNLIKMIAEI
uniref:Mom family adenine methylcarbamoylation protein n=1 Tax=Ornithobacterium rhinotracheale TaxID=28251 RepID=UPI0039A515B1